MTTYICNTLEEYNHAINQTGQGNCIVLNNDLWNEVLKKDPVPNGADVYVNQDQFREIRRWTEFLPVVQYPRMADSCGEMGRICLDGGKFLRVFMEYRKECNSN